MTEEDANLAMNDIIKREFEQIPESGAPSEPSPKEKTPTDANTSDVKPEESQFRLMKGLMRVGPLAKGLLLTGDKDVDLVVICAQKPTKPLLQRIVDLLPSQLQIASSTESFDIIMKAHESGLSVSTRNEPKITANVTLTSPLVREENSEGVATPGVNGSLWVPFIYFRYLLCETHLFADKLTTDRQILFITFPSTSPKCLAGRLDRGDSELEMVKEPQQLLDRYKCVEALAALRHAKWFQARVANLQPCPLIIRIFRDLCKRLPTWSKLSLWAIELLSEKVISSAGEPLAPGEALRHTFEAISSGILLPGGTGLVDPCEKDPTDALSALTRQEREDITSSAQHALRLIAFRQIYKILGVDPLPQKQRKRRLDSENGSAVEGELDVKKEKKEPTLEDNGTEDISALNNET
ncbi:unnamed protein product [Oppiella nova]|uniref:DZF domain-containing protein n=1 Tax=Oppiella nova TaxID=334625 RepID=A0A7R9M411_9ACAR|nr:unnamed protein product [Oppiella nova]CAG2170358.1 unnamed protein product [Oppiella nova]